MDVQNVLQELDGFFSRNEVSRIEPFLLDRLESARRAGDSSAELTLLNELMGFYRGMSRFSESLAVAEQTIALMDRLGYAGSVPYATTLLNVATAYRADGQTHQAIERFEQVARLFAENGVVDPFLIASLNNNLSLAYQEIDEHEKAIACLDRALPLIKALPDNVAEVAVTHTNRALSELRCDRFDDARKDLAEALRLFESQPTRNPHYGAALAAMGEVAYREGALQEAAGYYERALEQIGAHYGRNQYYAVTLESLAVVLETLDPERAAVLTAEARQIQSSLW